METLHEVNIVHVMIYMLVESISYSIYQLNDNSRMYSYETVLHARYEFSAIWFSAVDLYRMRVNLEVDDDNDAMDVLF
jgi:hypothetical protein